MLDMAETEILAWHFTSDNLRDGRAIPPIGEWLVHDGGPAFPTGHVLEARK